MLAEVTIYAGATLRLVFGAIDFYIHPLLVVCQPHACLVTSLRCAFGIR